MWKLRQVEIKICVGLCRLFCRCNSRLTFTMELDLKFLPTRVLFFLLLYLFIFFIVLIFLIFDFIFILFF
jgi:hypothetical protein